MNQHRKEELLTRWVDGTLSAVEERELAPLLAAHPELEGERDEYLRMREELRSVLPAEVEPPYPDFFNSHLKRQIESLPAGQGDEKQDRNGRLSRLWLWWTAPAATAALMVAFIAGMYSKPANVPAPIADGTAAYSPLDHVTAEAVRDEALDATVIVLTGLEDLDDDNLMGWTGSQGERPEFLVMLDNAY